MEGSYFFGGAGGTVVNFGYFGMQGGCAGGGCPGPCVPSAPSSVTPTAVTVSPQSSQPFPWGERLLCRGSAQIPAPRPHVAMYNPVITPKPLQSRAETTRGVTRSGDSARSPVSREGNVAVNTRQPGAGPGQGDNRLWAKLTARWGRERGGLVEQANTHPSDIPGTSAPAPTRHFQLFWDTEPLSRVTWWLSGVSWRCSGSRFCAKGVKTLWDH